MIKSHFCFLSTCQIHHLLPNSKNYSLLLGSQIRDSLLFFIFTSNQVPSSGICWRDSELHSSALAADLCDITAHTQQTPVFDGRETLLGGGSRPSLDKSSRLNRHTWSAFQPSAGTMGVWCEDPPLERRWRRPVLDSDQVVGVIAEPVPSYASADAFTARDNGQFDSQLSSTAV